MTRMRQLKTPFAPPSYQAAAYRQLWTIIAPYVQERDLYAACLVSQKWHQTFSPYLWGNPGSRFGHDSDTIYLSLTRFKRLLVRARHDVRMLAHTLHIPPAEPEFYGGPQSGWLRDILDRLPSLQALVVSNVSFFDHQCLQPTYTSTRIPPRSPSRYPLKLLIASDCENTTSQSLSIALAQFPDLMYLDLSGAHGARSPYVLHQIGSMADLKVLKLRNCGLRDDDIENLSFSSKLRSLDVSQNCLTERGISRLLLLIPPEILTYKLHHVEIHPLARGHAARLLELRLQAGNLETVMVSRLTRNLDSHLHVEEDLPDVFTSLHLASNYMTIDGLSRTIDHSAIRVLDCGLLNLSERPYDPMSPRSPTSSGSRRFSDPPDREILSPALFCHSFHNLTFLRISHTLVTCQPFSGKEMPVDDQCFELHDEELRFELDSRESCFEMEDTSVVAVPEPEAESAEENSLDHPAVPEVLNDKNEFKNLSKVGVEKEKEGEAEEGETHAIFESPDDVAVQLNKSLTTKTKSSGLKDGNSMTKELPDKVIPPEISISTPDNTSSTRHYEGLQSPVSPLDEPPKFHSHYTSSFESPWHKLEQGLHLTSTQELFEAATQRINRVCARERHPGRFKPSMLPNLKNLTLTDVPTVTRGHGAADAIALFIQECAEEEELARLEARAKHHRDTAAYDEKTMLKLQRLVLEMSAHSDPIFTPPSAHHATHLRTRSNSKRLSMTKSSTEDADSEIFMSNSSADFSFFDEDDGGLLVSAGRVDRKISVDGGLMVDTDQGRLVTTKMELIAWRREKKMRWEGLQRLRNVDDGREDERELDMVGCGFWRGEVKVVT